MTRPRDTVSLHKGKYKGDPNKLVPLTLAHGKMAKKFIAATTQNGGATMDLATGKLYGENGAEEAEAVGAEPSTITNRPVATHIYEGQGTLSGYQFAHEYQRLKAHTAPGASMGSWANKGNLEIDASRVFSDPMEASKVVVDRDQDASFDFRKFDDTPYEEHAKRIGSTKPQNKKEKVEVRIPSEAVPGDDKFRNE
jgi:hypothetical protein